MLSILVVGCVATSNPNTSKNVVGGSVCNTDLTQRIYLHRISFKLPEFWSGIQPCEAGKIIHNLRRDSWEISARALHYENGAYFSTGAMSFSVQSDIHLIGQKQKSPSEWLAWKKSWWKKSHREDYPTEHEVRRVKKNGMDCWKIQGKSYHVPYINQMLDLKRKEIIQKGVTYVCWEPGGEIYPPITISAGISYRNGKAVYPFDIEKHLLEPVFNTLMLKQLSKEELDRRLEEYGIKYSENCKRLINRTLKYKRENKYYNITQSRLDKVQECGYDIRELRRWWCESTIADSKVDVKNTQYYGHEQALKENLESCQR